MYGSLAGDGVLRKGVIGAYRASLWKHVGWGWAVFYSLVWRWVMALVPGSKMI
jgi:hypothetical protein